MNWTDTSHQHT